MARRSADVDEWGIPDWRRPQDYGVNDRWWDRDRWRWEFTRRRDDYRRDFHLAINGRTEPLDFSNPALLPDDIGPEDAMMFPGIRAFPFFHTGAWKYKLQEFFDPIISDWGGCGPIWGSGMILGGMDGYDYTRNECGDIIKLEAPHLTSLTFDLSLPLGPQLVEAKKELEELYNEYWYDEENDCMKDIKNVKHHPEKWFTYIRLLDARAAGASLAEMAEILPATMARRDARAAGNVLEQAKAQAFRF